MKAIVSRVVGSVCILLWSLNVWSDPPLAVGSAVLGSGSCINQVVVGPEGTFTPFLEGGLGVMFVELGNAKVVWANSANGNVNLTCHGNVTPGDTVIGIDVISGELVDGTVAERSDACSAIVAFGFPNPCRGEGEKSAIIIGPEFQGNQCRIGDVFTDNWKSVFNEGGYMLTCHAKD